MKDAFIWQIATSIFCIAAIGMGWAANHTNSYNDELWHENMQLRDSIVFMESRWEAYQEIQNSSDGQHAILMDTIPDTVRITGFGIIPTAGRHTYPADSASVMQGSNMWDEEDTTPYRKDTSRKRR